MKQLRQINNLFDNFLCDEINIYVTKLLICVDCYINIMHLKQIILQFFITIRLVFSW